MIPIARTAWCRGNVRERIDSSRWCSQLRERSRHWHLVQTRLSLPGLPGRIRCGTSPRFGAIQTWLAGHPTSALMDGIQRCLWRTAGRKFAHRSRQHPPTGHHDRHHAAGSQNQTRRPPTYRPPTYRPPTYRPPTADPPTYRPPTADHRPPTYNVGGVKFS